MENIKSQQDFWTLKKFILIIGGNIFLAATLTGGCCYLDYWEYKIFWVQIYFYIIAFYFMAFGIRRAIKNYLPGKTGVILTIILFVLGIIGGLLVVFLIAREDPWHLGYLESLICDTALICAFILLVYCIAIIGNYVYESKRKKDTKKIHLLSIL